MSLKKNTFKEKLEQFSKEIDLKKYTPLLKMINMLSLMIGIIMIPVNKIKELVCQLLKK